MFEKVTIYFQIRIPNKILNGKVEVKIYLNFKISRCLSILLIGMKVEKRGNNTSRGSIFLHLEEVFITKTNKEIILVVI